MKEPWEESNPFFKRVNEIYAKVESHNNILNKLQKNVSKITSALLGDEFTAGKGLIKGYADHEVRIKNIEIDKFLVIRIAGTVSGIVSFIGVVVGILFKIY